MIKGTLKPLDAILGPLCALVFLVLLLDVLWGVFTRYVLGDQARWTEELARFLMVWLAFLGASLAYARQAHLGVDILVSRMEPGARRLVTLIEHSVVFLFAVFVLGLGGTELFRERLASGQTMPALGILKAWQYFCVPVSGALIGLTAVAHFMQALAKSPDGQEVRP
jgi:TRAP-type C4-dicarboxylate transport system permease small subunit